MTRTSHNGAGARFSYSDRSSSNSELKFPKGDDFPSGDLEQGGRSILNPASFERVGLCTPSNLHASTILRTRKEG